jgi:sugar O-acyltransferase (sialic acid O-acetyltransferase NeuD family)
VTVHLIGAGGHATVVADLARRAGSEQLVVWSDDEPDLARFPPGTTHAPLSQLGASAEVVLAFGGLEDRARTRERFPGAPPALLDPTATLGSGVSLGRGTVVMARAVLNANARVGQDGILNTGCVIEHDCLLGDNVHISPGAVLTGGVRVGSGAHVGAGAVVLPGVAVGPGAVVGAGAVATRDVPEGATVMGNPAG